MKTNLLTTVIIFLTLTISSCTSDSESSIPPASADKTTFKLDGVLITPDEVTATDYNNTVAGGRYIDVYVKKGGKQILELHMPAVNGTYPAQHAALTLTSSWLTYQANDGLNFPADYFDSTTGSMKLTTCDLVGNKLRGTFEFVGNNTSSNKTITEGVLVVNTITHQ